MIITRTPFRISFFGGGTDYPVWYRENGGIVLNASINKYSFISLRHLPPFFDFKHRIRYYQHEEVHSIDEIKHPSVRHCAAYVGVEKGVDIVHNADLPARSGLGSSSSFTVGLLNAFFALQNKMIAKRDLALKTLHVEQDLIGETVGSQDQVAAAFGGLNITRFGGQTEIEVDPVILPAGRLAEFQDHLLLCFTGFARTASDVAKAQVANTKNKAADLRQMMDIANHAVEQLTDEKTPLDEFGKLLNEQWRIKRNLSSMITTPAIDAIYEAGMEAGAIGGKLLGAGSGGFILFFAKPEYHDQIKAKIGNKRFVPFRFDYTGSKVVYYSQEEF